MLSTINNIKRLPIDPGPCGWNKLLEKPRQSKILENNIIADWTIIGAGWAGLAAAKRLVQLVKGDKIVVLEAKFLGEGPSGRNSGFMIDVPHNLTSKKYESDLKYDKKKIIQNKAAIEFSKESFEEYNMPIDAFNPIGKINAAATEKGIKNNIKFHEHLKKLNIKSVLYDRKNNERNYWN